jgi:hypothetical protein
MRVEILRFAANALVEDLGAGAGLDRRLPTGATRDAEGEEAEREERDD